MNASIEERLAQRRRAREERRQREQEEQQQLEQQEKQEQQEVMFAAFGGSSMTRSTSMGNLFGAPTMRASAADSSNMNGGGMDQLRRQQSARVGGFESTAPSFPARPSLTRQGSLMQLKPPPKDTKSYNAALPSLAPPSKDTRPYNADDDVDNDVNNSNHPKRGSLQKQRSSSLTDMQKLQQQQHSVITPKTPKGIRQRPSFSKSHASTRNFSTKKLLDATNDDAPFDPYKVGSREQPRRGNLQRYRSSSLTDLREHTSSPNAPTSLRPRVSATKDSLSLRNFANSDDKEEKEVDKDSTPVNNSNKADSKAGREPKRGNLQRHRSSSLSDVQKLQKQNSGGTPKTPKGPRHRKMSARSFSGKKLAESPDDDHDGGEDGQKPTGGREAKRGNLQRHRSSSLTDLQEITPKTPKELRPRLSVSSDNHQKTKEQQQQQSLPPTRSSANGHQIADDAPPHPPSRSGRSPKRASLQRHRSSSLTDLDKHSTPKTNKPVKKQKSSVSAAKSKENGMDSTSDTENDDGGDDQDDIGASNKDNKVGREPKRGNLQMHRSSSLTDLQQDTPRTLKALRKARNSAGSKRISVKSLQITPTVIHPTDVHEVGEKSPSRPRRVSRATKLHSEESLKSNLELEQASSHNKGDSTTSETTTSVEDLPRFDPFAAPGEKKSTRSSKRSSVTVRTIKSADDTRSNHGHRRTLRSHGKGSSQQVSDGDHAPSTPARRSRKSTPTRDSHGTSPGRKSRTSKRASMLPEPSDELEADATTKTPKSSRQRPVMQRAKTIDGAELFNNMDDDESDDDGILFTPYRTPSTKKKASVADNSSDHKNGYGFDLPWEEPQQIPPSDLATSLQLTSQSMHHAPAPAPAPPPVSSKKASTAPTKSDGAPPASGWSMANSDQVHKWKSKLATKSIAANAADTMNSSAPNHTGQQRRRRNSLGNPSTSVDNSKTDLGAGKECNDGDNDDHNQDGVADLLCIDDRNTAAPPPLMNLTREEHLRNKKSNTGTKSRGKSASARAQSMRNLGTMPATRNSLDKSFHTLAIVNDNASTKEGRQRNSTTSMLEGSSKTLSSIESTKSNRNKGKGIQQSTTNNDSTRSSRSRSNSVNAKPEEDSGQSLRRNKSKERSQNNKEKAESHAGGRKSTRGNLSRTRSSSLSDLQDAVAGDGQTKVGANVRGKRRGTSRTRQLNNSFSGNEPNQKGTPTTNSPAPNVTNVTNDKMNSSDPNFSLDSNKKGATKIKKKKSGRSSTCGTSKRKSVASGEIKPESVRGSAYKAKSEQQRRRGSSKSPIKTSKSGKRRGAARTRSSSLSDLKSPRRATKRMLSTDKEKSDQASMDDSIPTIGMDESNHIGKNQARGLQDLSAEMHDSITRISIRGSRVPAKKGIQRSKTEDPTSTKNRSKASGNTSPARHRRTNSAVLGKGRPTLIRHRSNSLSDMREMVRSFRMPKKATTTATVPSALSTREEEEAIEQLKSHIEKLEAELKDATNSPARSPEATKKHLEEEVKKEQANQKALKGEIFDVYQDNVKLEENLEKTQQYYVELEDIHSAEVMKNEALLKNVPVFEKVIEAHETKLARRTRYIAFERQTMEFYQDRIRCIVRNFQSKCDDPGLVQALEHMARSDAPLPVDDNLAGALDFSEGSI